MLKEFTKVFLGILDGDTRWQLWNDFCEAVSITISQIVYSEEREKRFKEIMQKHKIEDFSKLFAITVSALDKNPEQDFLGTLFMQLELNSHWHGQFFTPYSLGAAMAKVNDFKCEKDYISINDPTCGSGCLLIAARNELLDKKIGSDRAFFVGQDISQIAGLMAHIQLSLLGCAGYIVIADTLRYPVYGGMLSPKIEYGKILYMPMYYSDVWQLRKGIEYVRKCTLYRQNSEC